MIEAEKEVAAALAEGRPLTRQEAFKECQGRVEGPIDLSDGPSTPHEAVHKLRTLNRLMIRKGWFHTYGGLMTDYFIAETERSQCPTP